MLYIVSMDDAGHNIWGIERSQCRTVLEVRLWEIVQWQQERIAVLERRVGKLEVALAKALKNSSTSSKPPSSDIVKPPKPPSSESGEKRKLGGQPGHVQHSRLPFDAASVAQTHTYTLQSCPHCHGPVELLPAETRVIQQVEVPATPVLRVEEHRGLAYWCQRCLQVHYAPLPPAVEKGGLIGPHLTAQLAYLKSAHHASFSTLRTHLRDVMGLTVSRGYLVKILGKVTEALQQPYGELAALLPSEPVLNVDETGHKENKRRFWTWCFRAGGYTLFKIAPSRGSVVLWEVLGEEFAGVLGCDFFSAYRKYMKHCHILVQLCLAHFIREIKFLITLPDPDAVAYGKRLLDTMRALFHVIHQRETMAPAAFTAALCKARQAILREAQRHVPAVREAQLVAKRLRNYGDAYFQFITTPGVEPTNNLAEQAIRFVAIDRHITQGTRSERGREWSERIWTVLATCATQKRSAYDYLVEVVEAHFNGLPIPSLLAIPP